MESLCTQDKYMDSGITEVTEMANNKRNERGTRQDWTPSAFLKILYSLWAVATSLLKIALGAAATVVLIVFICGMVFAGALGDYLQDGVMVQAGTELNKTDLEKTSFGYYVDEDGQIQTLQMVYTSTDRQWASYEEIPQDMIKAAVAIEDKRFFEHQGVDWIPTAKACVRMFFGDSSVGGSTITQQLIKNTTKRDSITVQRKVLEWFEAIQLEKDYTKEQVLEWYLNTIYLGEDCYGVKSAAASYFGKELECLTTAECASIISITNNPSMYDPYLDAEQNRERQLNVLGEMLDQELITKEEYEEAIAQELEFKWGIDDEDKMTRCPNEDCGYRDLAKTFDLVDEEYYCPVCGTRVKVGQDASRDIYSWFFDTVLEDVAKAMAAKDGITEWDDDIRAVYVRKIQIGGYHIYTTMDMRVQELIDRVYLDLDNLPEARSGQQLQSAIVVVDNRTGDIVGMAGGVGEKMYFDEFNRATESQLQTGSSIKPLSVYAPAFEAGVVSPATVIDDLPLYYDDGGAFPLNFERTYNYTRTVYEGVRQSINAVAVGVLDKVGTDYSYYTIKNQLGLSTLVDEMVLDSGYTLSDNGYAPLGLGALTYGATVRDMTCAFATFANNGVYRQGRTFTKVYDTDGNLVIDNTQVQRDVFSKKTVDYMNYCMLASASYGIEGLADIGVEVAGKTGTTSDNKDRWFCGLTGYYTAAVWVGYDYPEVISLVGDYRNPAGRLWNRVMEPLHAGLPDIDLYDRDYMWSVSVCLDCGGSITEACSKDVRGISRIAYAKVYYEDLPGYSCTCHTEVDYCVTGKGVATDFCRKFAEATKNDGSAAVKIEKKSLVKMTESRVEEMLKAKYYNLGKDYLRDDYIYLVTRSGADAKFYGMDGKANKGQSAPYIVCPVHTQKAWEEYEKAHAKPEETEPAPGTTTPVTPAGG